jgi:hypothetical protein
MLETGQVRATYDADVRLRMRLCDRREDLAPVGPPEVRWRTQGRDGVLLGADVVDLCAWNETNGRREQGRLRTMILFMSSSLMRWVR